MIEILWIFDQQICRNEPFQSINAYIDATTLMRNSVIIFDGMVHVIYNDCSTEVVKLYELMTGSKGPGK